MSSGWKYILEIPTNPEELDKNLVNLITNHTEFSVTQIRSYNAMVKIVQQDSTETHDRLTNHLLQRRKVQVTNLERRLRFSW
jgi:hypothetical protein